MDAEWVQFGTANVLLDFNYLMLVQLYTNYNHSLKSTHFYPNLLRP
jgi:hypothetical protein